MNTLAAVGIATCFYFLLGLVLSLGGYTILQGSGRALRGLRPDQRADLYAAAILAPPVLGAMLAIASFGGPQGPHEWCRHIQHLCFDRAEQQGFCLLFLDLPIALSVLLLAVAARRAASTVIETVRLNQRLAQQLVAPSEKLAQAIRCATRADGCPVPMGETDGSQPLSLVFGIHRPRCILTRSLVEGTTGAELTGVVAHELAHVDRRDNLLKLVLRLAVALQWLFPWVPALMRQWQLEVELACDDQAVRTTGQPHPLAMALIKVAQAVPRSSHAFLNGEPVVSGFCEAGQGAVRVRVARLIQHLTESEHDPGSAAAAMVQQGRPRVSSALYRPLLAAVSSVALVAGVLITHRLLAPSIACLADNLLRHGH